MRCRRQVFTIKFQINDLSEYNKKLAQKSNLQNPNFHYKNLRKFGLVLVYLDYLERQEKSRCELDKNRPKPNFGMKRPSRQRTEFLKNSFFQNVAERERELWEIAARCQIFTKKILGLSLSPTPNFRIRTQKKFPRKNFQKKFTATLPCSNAMKICNI